MNELTEREWYKLCNRWTSKGYTSLNEFERVWLSVRELIDCTNNGGMISYFYNSGADHLDDCIASLEQLGADEVKEQVFRLCCLFQNGVPRTPQGRNEVISSWDQSIEGLLDEIDEATFLLVPDLEVRLDEFVSHNIH